MPGEGGCTNCGGGSFRAGIEIVSWYPKLDTATNRVEYLFECKGIDGSGNYNFDWNFGNGRTTQYDYYRKGEFYPYEDRNYNVSCKARDLNNGMLASASMIINPSHYIDDGVE